MSAGRVCEKHHEWCPTGECRWCEPVTSPLVPAFDMPTDGGMLIPPELTKGMREHWRRGVMRLNGAPVVFDPMMPGEPLTFDGQPLDSLFWEGGRQPRGAIDIDGAMNRMWVDAMNRMWVKLVEREQPPRLPFDEWLEFYGKKDGG